MPSHFRANIASLAGYVPGEQPQNDGIIKLNTNENPYPPSPRVYAAIR
ncbi:MAG TPA: histidinol-phosphate transaminase, partial [Candidatus Binatia bacterium]